MNFRLVYFFPIFYSLEGTTASYNFTKWDLQHTSSPKNLSYQKNLFQNQRHQHWQHYQAPRSRRLAIPKGTVVTLTPEIKVPIVNIMNDGVELKSTFGATFPMSITFKDTSLDKLGEHLFDFDFDPMRRKASVWNTAMTGFGFMNRNGVPRHYRKTRDLKFFNLLDIMTRDNFFTVIPKKVVKCPVKSLTERKGLLEQAEMAGMRVLLGMEGNSKDCLLRAICELHEDPLQEEMGLVGEILTVALSFEKLSNGCNSKEHASLMSSLRPYLDAELSGKSRKCGSYQKKCSKSIFTYE